MTMEETESPCCVTHQRLQDVSREIFHDESLVPLPRAVVLVASVEAFDMVEREFRPYGLAASSLRTDKPEHCLELVRVLREIADDLELRFRKPEGLA